MGLYLHDFGASWTARIGIKRWRSVGVCSDGITLVAAAELGEPGQMTGEIYTSTDAGSTWNPVGIGAQPACSALSGDGRIVLVGNASRLTVLLNGQQENDISTPAPFASVIVSANGSNVVGVVYGGRIYTSYSPDGRSWAPWTARDTAREWRSVTTSADGSKLAAVAGNDRIYTSTDFGVTWTARATVRNWKSITSSANGNFLLAGVDGGQLYVSSDSGLNWFSRESVRNWKAVASSLDGSKLFAAVGGGRIYSSDPPALSPSTTPGPAGFLIGGQHSTIELLYVGDDRYLALSHQGTIWGY